MLFARLRTLALERSPGWLRAPVLVAWRTVEDSLRDRVPGLAAEIAFWMLLSTGPLLVSIVSAVALVGDLVGAPLVEDVTGTLLEVSRRIFSPRTVRDTIEPTITGLLASDARSSVFTVGFLLTLFSASRALRAVVVAVTIAYDAPEPKPGWAARLHGLGLTAGGLLVGAIVLPLLTAGPQFGSWLARTTGASPVFAELWRIGYWPAAGAVSMLLLAVLFHATKPIESSWWRDLPGAAVSMLLWLAGSLLLRSYTQRTILGDSAFGEVAGPVVLLVWLYVTGLAVLIGAEINAEIDKLWPRTRADARRWDRLEPDLPEDRTHVQPGHPLGAP